MQAQIKIAVNTRFLLKNKLEGFGHFTFETLKRITQNNPHIQFYFLFDRPFDKAYVFSSNVHPVLLYPPARHPWLWYFWFEISTALWLKIYKPNLYLSTDGYACLNTNTKQVMVMHDLAFEHFDDNIKSIHKKYLRKNTPKFAHKVNRIATVSQYSKNDIVELYNIKSSKIDVVYNGANNFYYILNEAEKLATKMLYSQGKDYFVYVGSIHPRKNVSRLLQAFDNYKTQTGSDKKILLVGRMAWQTSDVSQTYNKLKHQKDVIFTGYLANEALANCVGAAFAMCYVSLFEGFGIPIIEAMKAGVPVVCSNVSSMLEIGDGATLQVNPYSIEEIAQAMVTLENNTKKREVLIQQGLLKQQHYTWDNTAQKLWQCCLQVIGNIE